MRMKLFIYYRSKMTCVWELLKGTYGYLGIKVSWQGNKIGEVSPQ